MSRHLRRELIHAALAVVAVLVLARAADAAPPEPEFDYDERYYEALVLYGENGDFDGALAIIDTLLATDPPDQQQREAFELQALCLIGAGRDDEAMASFCGILCVDEYWRPDLRFGPHERDVFGLVSIQDCGCDRGGFPWKWVGAAAAIVAGSVIPFLSGDDSPTEPPAPPVPGVPSFPDEP
jgi:hypothetical protein